MHWRKLCRAAAIEQDADKVWQIVRKIDAALSSRQRLLRLSARDSHQRIPDQPQTSTARLEPEGNLVRTGGANDSTA